MSPNAHITSHRKPRRTATQSWVVRTGVAGGVLSTLAVAGAGSATAAEKPVESTVEMPAVNAALATSIAQSAAATQQTSFDFQDRAQQDEATSKVEAAAKKAADEASRKAEAERKAAAAKEKREQQEAERASRATERKSLSGKSAAQTSEDAATAASSSAKGAATGSTATLVSFLEAQLGKAYVMGSTGPSSYDCSGLVMAAYNQIGISLPRVSQDQSTAGTQVSLSNLQVGDILYWGSAGSAYHVAVYVGGGKFIGAQNPSTGIVERDMSYSPPTGAVRVL
ncbi:C40 family peptidase [Streptomyces sp. URMC 127]|uniref:C40 family peptidase n=1 Tax=Streptomyces sp. URMC 127 TaxID=3423402 RepID=UPI003F1E3346